MTALRRRRGDRGAVVVEFALIAPLLFGLIFGMLELGLAVAGRTVGANAAREGARVGILVYLDADDTGSANYQAIEDAARDKLVGMVKEGTDFGVVVRCLDYDLVQSNAVNPSKPCSDEGVNPVEVGRDMIEVEVSWKPIVLSGFFTSSARTDRARMTIVGLAQESGGGGSGLAELNLSCSPTTLTETDGNQTVTCGVARSSTTAAATVQYATSDGTAVAPGDYATTNGVLVFPANGAATMNFTVTVAGETLFEPSETFTVAISGPNNAFLGANTHSTITIENDDPADTTAPTAVLRLFDTSGNGITDTITATFNEAIGACTGTGAWTVKRNGTPLAPPAASRSGQVVTLTFTESGQPVNTAVGGITVSLATGSGGYCDGAGNNTVFTDQAPNDFARPILVSMVSANGGATVRRPEINDTITFTFSEPMVAPAGPASISLSRASGNNKPTVLGISPVSSAGANTSPVDQWFSGNGDASVTFVSSVTASTNTLVVRITGACVGSECSRVIQGDTAGVTFTMPVNPALTDNSGNLNLIATTTKIFTNVVLF